MNIFSEPYLPLTDFVPIQYQNFMYSDLPKYQKYFQETLKMHFNDHFMKIFKDNDSPITKILNQSINNYIEKNKKEIDNELNNYKDRMINIMNNSYDNYKKPNNMSNKNKYKYF